PALFLTDITEAPSVICTPSDPDPTRCHDWQWGGMPIAPNAVFGTWKAASRTSTGAISTGTDPAKNNFDLDGSGCTAGVPSPTCPDPVPSGLTNQGYGAEARWDVNRLQDSSGVPVMEGHIYRAQFMVHDGDQNKSGGDVGEGCATIFIVPTPNCPPVP